MTDSDFVDVLRKTVLEENTRLYEQMLARNYANTVTSIPKEMVAAFAKMSPVEQRAMLDMIRQVVLDTLSNVCGILDGVCILDDYREDFTLTYGGSERPLNGDLQDLLLNDDV